MKANKFLVILTFLSINTSVSAQKVRCDIKDTEAKDHLGEELTVCGKIVQLYQPKYTKGKPIYLNFDRNYPNNCFTAVIWEDAFKNEFSAALVKYYFGKEVAVYGTVKEFKGKPQIVIKEKSQIQVIPDTL